MLSKLYREQRRRFSQFGMLPGFWRLAFALGIVGASVASLLPSYDLPETGLDDKVAHLAVYFALAFTGMQAATRFSDRLLIIAGVGMLGCCLELAQVFVPGRSADVHDLAANALGILVGTLFACFLSNSGDSRC